MRYKYCPHCQSRTETIKFGTTSAHKQRYRCKQCYRTWTTKSHPQVLARKLWYDMIFHNSNVAELADAYGISTSSIRRRLAIYEAPEIIPQPADIIAMDVTYFGHSGGLLTVINALTGHVLYCEPTRAYETVEDYRKAILKLHEHGVYPKACVVDGKGGVIEMLESFGIKVQFCQFHQQKIISQCLSRSAIHGPDAELKSTALSLKKLSHKDFERAIHAWRINNSSWLAERTYFQNGRWTYTHKLTRRAINSLTNNLPYLYTFQDYPELNIPNTNNRIEGLHSELKRRLANHRGLKMSQKVRFARIFFIRRTEKRKK